MFTWTSLCANHLANLQLYYLEKKIPSTVYALILKISEWLEPITVFFLRGKGHLDAKLLITSLCGIIEADGVPYPLYVLLYCVCVVA